MAKTVRAALYARVSTLNGQDVGLQLDELRQVAGQRVEHAVEAGLQLVAAAVRGEVGHYLDHHLLPHRVAHRPRHGRGPQR